MMGDERDDKNEEYSGDDEGKGKKRVNMPKNLARPMSRMN